MADNHNKNVGDLTGFNAIFGVPGSQKIHRRSWRAFTSYTGTHGSKTACYYPSFQVRSNDSQGVIVESQRP